AVVEDPLPAGAAPAEAAEDLVERLLDRQVRLEEELLRGALAEGAQHLIHALDPPHLDADPRDAPEGDAVEALVQPPHGVGRLAQLHVEAARDVLGRAAEIELLGGEALFEETEVALEPLEGVERVGGVG